MKLKFLMTRLKQINLSTTMIDTAKISTISSGELEKYEYLKGEDLEYEPTGNKRSYV